MKTNRWYSLTVVAVMMMAILLAMVSCSKGSDIPVPQVSGIKISDITATSAAISASVTDLPQKQTTVYIQITKQGTTSSPQNYSVNPDASGNISTILSGLDAGTVYTGMITTGTTASSSFSFTTLSTSGIRLLPAEKVTLTSATLNAKIVANNANTTVIFQYKKKNGGTDWTKQPLANSYSGNDSVTVSLDLTGLEKGTEYQYCIVLKNQAGEFISSTNSFITYSVADYDGNLYHLVTIGNQTWLQENFRGTHFANGDPIPLITINADGSNWISLTTPAMCYYNNDPKNGPIYGGLYNWYAASDPRGLIQGMHLPSQAEWNTLFAILGGKDIAASKMGPGTDFNGIYSGGFGNDGYGGFCFGDLNSEADYWSSTLVTPNLVQLDTGISKKYPCILGGCDEFYIGLSIRLVAN